MLASIGGLYEPIHVHVKNGGIRSLKGQTGGGKKFTQNVRIAATRDAARAREPGNGCANAPHSIHVRWARDL